MGKLKSFFYSKNDIIVALLILVLALGVIGFRVKAFLDYPQRLMQQSVTSSDDSSKKDSDSSRSTSEASDKSDTAGSSSSEADSNSKDSSSQAESSSEGESNTSDNQ